MKFIMNDDGTIKTKVVVLSVVVILAISGFFLLKDDFKAMIYNMKVKEMNNRTTTTIKMCKDCNISFIKESIELNVGASLLLNDLIKLKNINLKYVDFSVEDNEMLKFESNANNINIVALDKVGSTKLIAKYYDVVAELKVNVVYSDIESVTLIDKNYEVALGTTEKIELITKPSGIDLRDVDIKIANPEIAYLDENLNIVPVSLGSTDIVLNFNGIETRKTFRVVNNRIIVFFKDKMKYEEIYEFNASKLKDDFVVAVQFQDNKKVGYTRDDIEIDIRGEGFKVEMLYDGVNIDKDNFVNYRVKLLERYNDIIEKYAIVKLSLPDGSSVEFKIIG